MGQGKQVRHKSAIDRVTPCCCVLKMSYALHLARTITITIKRLSTAHTEALQHNTISTTHPPNTPTAKTPPTTHSSSFGTLQDTSKLSVHPRPSLQPPPSLIPRFHR
ncbi:hypothetical protein E2C01_017531 [Portunus trituberculatus]|uniref:Uncharacterized protein n=1 Tax=Portunus trituberculatus TaxID=210409 RepID=A0A5B7DSQ7_PORTR|nr:hypothetical protein [Portunus trituberculatus]